MNLEMGKILTSYLYGLFIVLQSVLAYLVSNGYFLKKYGPKVMNSFDGAILQGAGIIPMLMSIVFFFILGSKDKIRDRIASDSFIKHDDELSCEEIARFEIVAMWTNSWALISTITMTGVLSVTTYGISPFQFYFSFGLSMALMLFTFPRPSLLRVPLGHNRLDNKLEFCKKADAPEKREKMSA